MNNKISKNSTREKRSKAQRMAKKPTLGQNLQKSATETDAPERIAKRMARAGLCSRREAETWIAAGRVNLNGKTLTTPAITVTSTDKIEVDGKELSARERTRLWLYHKPDGVLTTNKDPEGRPTLFERLPKDMPRVMSVGRLDMNTEGLMLLTNDGGLARVLELPSTGWLRRYRVRAFGKTDQAKLDELKEGIAVDGILYGSIEALIEREQGSNIWLTVSIREGKNREVKRVLGAIGLEVNRLIRISYGPFQLGELEKGGVREIRGRTLRDQLGEKLIGMSGADFEAPIIHHNIAQNTAQSKAGPSPKRFGAGSKKKPNKRKAGVIEGGTRDRLLTKGDSARKRGRKATKRKSGNS